MSEITSSPELAPSSDEIARLERVAANFYILIRSDETYAVGINLRPDKKFELHWETIQGNMSNEGPNAEQFNAISVRATELRSIPMDELLDENKISFLSLVGEGFACALEAEFQSAASVLDSAKSFIDSCRAEISRSWYLCAAIQATAFALVLFSGIWCLRVCFIHIIGHTALSLLLTSLAGAGGAILSIVWRTGELCFTPSSGRRIHRLEAYSRVGAGVISAGIAGLAVQLRLILSSLTSNGHLFEVMLLAGVTAGTSERLASSIMAQIGSANREERLAYKTSPGTK